MLIHLFTSQVCSQSTLITDCERQDKIFVIAGFVIARFVSIYFTAILPGVQMLFVMTGLPFCFLWFTSLVSVTGFYTEDEAL